MKAKKKSKMGRPPKKPEDRRSHLVTIRLTPPEWRDLGKAAAARGLAISDFIMEPWRNRGGE
jgi:uncharacterized protein (DUF1778 family)